MRVSKNFDFDELLVSEEHPELAPRLIDLPSETVINICRTIWVLQSLRDRFGTVFVTSGFRSAQLNEAVGGANSSRHLTGCAADFHLGAFPPDTAWRKIRDGEVKGVWDRLAFYPNGGRFHLDVTEDGKEGRGLLYLADPNWRLIGGQGDG